MPMIRMSKAGIGGGEQETRRRSPAAEEGIASRSTEACEFLRKGWHRMAW